jgi:2,5-diketo-D-gluconate reductase A
MISPDIPTLKLPGGQIPVVGLGTWQSEGGAAERAVSAALQLGYRHIDTATGYGN